KHGTQCPQSLVAEKRGAKSGKCRASQTMISRSNLIGIRKACCYTDGRHTYRNRTGRCQIQRTRKIPSCWNVRIVQRVHANRFQCDRIGSRLKKAFYEGEPN
ncbi:Hypothetical protein CINCED_3A011507, partial [Cinara cedri]